MAATRTISRRVARRRADLVQRGGSLILSLVPPHLVHLGSRSLGLVHESICLNWDRIANLSLEFMGRLRELLSRLLFDHD